MEKPKLIEFPQNFLHGSPGISLKCCNCIWICYIKMIKDLANVCFDVLFVVFLGVTFPLLKIVCKYNVDTCLFLIIQFFFLFLSRFISTN